MTSSPGAKPLCTSQSRIGSGYAARVAGEHRDDGDAGMHRHEARAAEHRVVEVRRHDDDAVELAVVGQAPVAHRERVVPHRAGRAAHAPWRFVLRLVCLCRTRNSA